MRRLASPEDFAGVPNHGLATQNASCGEVHLEEAFVITWEIEGAIFIVLA